MYFPVADSTEREKRGYFSRTDTEPASLGTFKRSGLVGLCSKDEEVCEEGDFRL